MQTKWLFTLLSVAAASFSIAMEIHGQCGVYMRRVSTQFFPQARIYVDKAEDMTGDGIPDLIASTAVNTSSDVTRSRIFIIPNNGSGVFGTPITLDPPAGGSFNGLFSIGYVNNDSLKDFVFLTNEPGGNFIRAYINNGNGTFTPGPTSSNSGAPQFGILHLNGDAYGDLITTTAPLTYRPGNADSSFGTAVSIPNSNFSLPGGDFNADGKVDAISRTTLLLNQGDGTFTQSDVSSFFPNSSQPIFVADFNGDGRSDVLSDGRRVLLKTDSSFTSTLLVPTFGEFNPEGYRWVVGNFSGNAALDIVMNDDHRNRKMVFTNDGDGNFTGQEYSGALVNRSPQSHQFGDFDNDGKTDVLRSTSRVVNTSVLFQDITSFNLMKNVCNQPGETRIVDFDRSGSTDYSFWNPANGDWSFTTNNDSFSRTETVNWGLGSLGDIPTPGDYDGDGITDRAVYRDSTGVWYIRRSSDGNWAVTSFGLTNDKPVAADYDGDTITDIAVFRPSDGNWHVWYMGTQQYGVVHFGADGDKPTPADFDGDYKTDFAVFRPSTGVWYYLRSTDGTYNVIQWGLSADKPLPGDFDGDGKADITVYRDSDHTFYILRSQNSAFAAFGWGTSGDIPAVTDFDGDFVADVVVYRPSSWRWFPTNTIQLTFGTAGAMPTSSVFRVE